MEINEPLLDKQSDDSNDSCVLSVKSKKSVHSLHSDLTNYSFMHKHLDENMTNIEISSNLVINSITASLGIIYYFIHDTTNIIVINKFKDSDLVGSFGIAMLYLNIVALSFGIGLFGGIETLCSNAFGARKFTLVGKHFFIGKLIVLVFYFCISLPMILFSFKLLFLIGISNTIAYEASIFCVYMIISIFFNLLFLSSISYLQSMNIYRPGMYVSCGTIILYPFLCNYLAYDLNLRQIGIGISSAILNLTNYILIQIYISYYNEYPKSNEKNYIKEICKVVKSNSFKIHLQIGISSALLYSAEWIGIEISCYISAFLSSDALASNTIFMLLIMNLNLFHYGLNMAVLNIVGNCVGYKSKTLTQRFINLSILISISVFLVLIILANIFKEEIVIFYSNNESVKMIIYNLITIYSVYCVCDSLQMVLSGILRGLGMQSFVAKIYIISYLLFNLPLMIILSFYFNFDIYGIWLSLGSTAILLSCVQLYKIYTIDFEDMIKENNLYIKS